MKKYLQMFSGKCIFFIEDVFSEGQEMLIFVTELTTNYYSGHFISKYGCPKYFEHNKELLFYERQKEIIKEIEKLDISTKDTSKNASESGTIVTKVEKTNNAETNENDNGTGEREMMYRFFPNGQTAKFPKSK